jgi:hypothetical protein
MNKPVHACPFARLVVEISAARFSRSPANKLFADHESSASPFADITSATWKRGNLARS